MRKRIRFLIVGTIGVLVAVVWSVWICLDTRHPTESPDSVRVAAVQYYSRMGAVASNRRELAELIALAAGRGAKIVVLPEAAVTGYMDVSRDLVWTGSDDRRGGTLPLHDVAEEVPGPSTRYFAKLAADLEIYLVVTLIEKKGDTFYNVQVLLGPDGEMLLHHRKRNAWFVGDADWMTEGALPTQVVSTPYGRLGLMICFDVHTLSRELSAAGADIVLWSVGWFGPNAAGWFATIFPAKYVVPNKFAAVAANWAVGPGESGEWAGAGYSTIVDRDGKTLAISKFDTGPEIVLADIPIRLTAIHQKTISGE